MATVYVDQDSISVKTCSRKSCSPQRFIILKKELQRLEEKKYLITKDIHSYAELRLCDAVGGVKMLELSFTWLKDAGRDRVRPRAWRRGKHLPKVQGLVVGCEMRGKRVTALVDGDDIHAMMVAGSGAGKTAYFLYPNLEYCCAAGMSFLTSDTKGGATRS